MCEERREFLAFSAIQQSSKDAVESNTNTKRQELAQDSCYRMLNLPVAARRPRGYPLPPPAALERAEQLQRGASADPRA